MPFFRRDRISLSLRHEEVYCILEALEDRYFQEGGQYPSSFALRVFKKLLDLYKKRWPEDDELPARWENMPPSIPHP